MAKHGSVPSEHLWAFLGTTGKSHKNICHCQGADAEDKPALFAGVTVKGHMKYLGILLENISVDKAYAPVTAKMMARARSAAILPLGLEEEAFLFASWIAPVCYLMA